MAERHCTDGTDVELPQDVIDRIEARLPETGFDSVDAYAASALDLLLRDVATAGQDGGAGASPTSAGDPAASEDGSTTDAATAAADADPADTSSAEDGLAEQSADRPRTNQVTDAPDRDAVEEQLESLGYL